MELCNQWRISRYMVPNLAQLQSRQVNYGLYLLHMGQLMSPAFHQLIRLGFERVLQSDLVTITPVHLAMPPRTFVTDQGVFADVPHPTEVDPRSNQAMLDVDQVTAGF